MWGEKASPPRRSSSIRPNQLLSAVSLPPNRYVRDRGDSVESSHRGRGTFRRSSSAKTAHRSNSFSEGEGIASVKSIFIPRWDFRSNGNPNAQHVVFIIQVCAHNGFAWALEKRYSEFYSLYQSLKAAIPRVVKKISFPGKHQVLFQSKSSRGLEHRRIKLEEYLRELLNLRFRPTELQTFLFTSAANPKLSMDELLEAAVGHINKDIEGRFSSASAQFRQDLEEATAPTVKLADFAVQKMIGQGSFAKVFLVKRKDTRELFAMKMLDKNELKKSMHMEHARTEMRVLTKIVHPFLLSLQFSFETVGKVFLISDYYGGGELFYHLRRFKTLQESMIRFYTAEIICALRYLHHSDIIFRDLKPENILIEASGHIRLADFGLSKDYLPDSERTFTFCGTPEYLAPEILINRSTRAGYGKGVDWWSLGAMVYEMAYGLPPFFSESLKKMCERILKAPLAFPQNSKSSFELRSLICGLLVRDPEYRLGMRYAQSGDDVTMHPFFDKIDWEQLEMKTVTPPFRPRVRNESDLSNFEDDITSAAAFRSKSFFDALSAPATQHFPLPQRHRETIQKIRSRGANRDTARRHRRNEDMEHNNSEDVKAFLNEKSAGRHSPHTSEQYRANLVGSYHEDNEDDEEEKVSKDFPSHYERHNQREREDTLRPSLATNAAELDSITGAMVPARKISANGNLRGRSLNDSQLSLAQQYGLQRDSWARKKVAKALPLAGGDLWKQSFALLTQSDENPADVEAAVLAEEEQRRAEERQRRDRAESYKRERWEAKLNDIDSQDDEDGDERDGDDMESLRPSSQPLRMSEILSLLSGMEGAEDKESSHSNCR